MNRAWAIKLGSGGSCISFCEKRGIVGVGWEKVKYEPINGGTKAALRLAVIESGYYSNQRDIGRSVGSLYRFCVECKIGDYILYYDPPKKRVRIARVESEVHKRDASDGDRTDIWFYRTVSYPEPVKEGIPIVSFDGSLKGSLLGPRGTFWSIDFNRVNQIARGEKPNMIGATNEQLEEATGRLRELIRKRASILNDKDWEILTADYFRSLGGHVGKVGGSQAVQDFEAVFCKGSPLEQKWRVQVKRYQEKRVGWNEVNEFIDRVDDESINLCYVSVFGFTEEAIVKADSEDGPGVKLLDMEDFFQFILSGRYNPELAEKMGI